MKLVWIIFWNLGKNFLKKNDFFSVDQARVYRNLSVLKNFPKFQQLTCEIKGLAGLAKEIVDYLKKNPNEEKFWANE